MNLKGRRMGRDHRPALRPLPILSLLAGFLLPCGAASAHDVALTRVRACFDPPGRFQVDLIYDVDAFVLGLRPEHLTAEDLESLRAMSPEDVDERLDELRSLALHRVRLRFDDQKTAFDVSFPTIDSPETVAATQTDAAHGSRSNRIIRLSGEVPEGATQFVFWASRSFGNVILEFVDAAGVFMAQQLLEKGARSDPFDLRRPAQPAGFFSVVRDYAVLGFEHIIPEGLDHILFVLGLFLLSTKMGPLLWQVSAFTLAHTVTLACATYGVIHLAPSIVEPLIALSIAYVAIENVCTSKLHAWRPIVVFAFGLLHGLGFSGVLQELGLPPGRVATALVSFNVGVEIGQLAVIALAFLVVGWFRHRPWYRRRIVIPASLAIAAVGLYWSLERTGLV
ncbi:MAG: HupE/UreJ family protein [Planctomycetes bacterium]|nr:HupE/UreJ family protein [Planctomycetota bacterium]